MNTTELSILTSIFLFLLAIILIEALIIWFLIREKLIPDDKKLEEMLK